EELNHYLAPRFETIVARGFNASVHEAWDETITDQQFIKSWISQFEDRPDLATSLVLLLRRREDYRPGRYLQDVHRHDGPTVAYAGPWDIAPLHRNMTARRALGGDASFLALDFEGTDLLVFLWSHPWSGYAFVEVDGVCPEPLNLYSTQSGFRRLHYAGLAPGRHRLQIRGSWHRDPR